MNLLLLFPKHRTRRNADTAAHFSNDICSNWDRLLGGKHTSELYSIFASGEFKQSVAWRTRLDAHSAINTSSRMAIVIDICRRVLAQCDHSIDASNAQRTRHNFRCHFAHFISSPNVMVMEVIVMDDEWMSRRKLIFPYQVTWRKTSSVVQPKRSPCNASKHLDAMWWSIWLPLEFSTKQ